MTCQCRGRIRNRFRLAAYEHHSPYFCSAQDPAPPSLPEHWYLLDDLPLCPRHRVRAESGGQTMTPPMRNLCAVPSPDGVYTCELPWGHAPSIYASHRFQDVAWSVWLDGTNTYSPPPRDNPQLRHCVPCSREWIGPVGGPCDSCEGPGRIGPLGWACPPSRHSIKGDGEDEIVRPPRVPWWRRWWKP